MYQVSARRRSRELLVDEKVTPASLAPGQFVGRNETANRRVNKVIRRGEIEKVREATGCGANESAPAASARGRTRKLLRPICAAVIRSMSLRVFCSCRHISVRYAVKGWRARRVAQLNRTLTQGCYAGKFARVSSESRTDCALL